MPKTRRKIDHCLYARYKTIKFHLENPRSLRHEAYRALGIEMYEPWRRDFWQFAEWIERNLGLPHGPEDFLDRKNNLRDYQPGNLKWSTAQENQRNRRDTEFIRYQGRVQSLGDWCDELKLNKQTVWSRIHDLGWSTHRAFKQGRRPK